MATPRKQARPRAKAATPAKPSARVMLVTPEQAAAWLDGNVHNRRLVQRRVDDLTGVILRGEWQLNGDGIRFDANGTLLDGQHRLWAVVLSERAVEMLVVRGLAQSSQETMDLGARRNLGDVLRLRGHRNPGALATVVSYWWRYENGFVRVPSARPSIPQASAVLEANPTLVEVVDDTAALVRRFHLPKGVVAAAWYEFHSIDAVRAGQFMQSLLDGKGLLDGDPVLALRHRLERRASGEDRVSSRGDAVVIHALFVKSWNAHRSGLPMERLYWRSTGMNAEGFPEAE